MGTETETGTETEVRHRSDRWAASGKTRNPWATVALLCALLGLAAAGAIAGATAGLSLFEGLPDEAGYVLYGAVPSFGVLGLAFGAVAVRRPRYRWLSIPVIVLAAIEVLASIAVLVMLVSATRSL